MLNTGDIAFQIFMMLMIIVPVVVVILLVISFSKRNERLKRIEEKLDQLVNEHKKK